MLLLATHRGKEFLVHYPSATGAGSSQNRNPLASLFQHPHAPIKLDVRGMLVVHDCRPYEGMRKDK